MFNHTGANEQDAREKLWLAYNIIGKVEQHMKQMLETGTLAKKQLEDFRKEIESEKF